MEIWNSLDGSVLNEYELFDTGGSNGAPNVTFGKAHGLGDLEMLCGPAPLEIGNYVWLDANENGIQDAGEVGVDNVLVSLYDINGVLVGQDTTSNLGQYYFNQLNVDTTGIVVDATGAATPVTAWTGMSPSTNYFIVFGDTQFSSNMLSVGGASYEITVANAGVNDNIDSDVDGAVLSAGALGARPDGLSFIDMVTAETGCGDHKYDLGLTEQEIICEIPLIYECGSDSTRCNLTIQQVYADTYSCIGGIAGTIDMNVIVNYVNAPAGDINLNGTTFTPSGINGIDTFLLTGLPCLDKDVMDVVAFFENSTSCRDSINTGLEPVTPRYDDLGWDCTDNSGSQTFLDWDGTGLDVTISYSDNMYDGVPNIYQVPCSNGNDDTHCMTEYHGSLRFTNNRNSVDGQPKGTATGPSYLKYAFDEPVFIKDFLIGSISILGDNSSEWVHVSAYDTTGMLSFPSQYSTGAENCNVDGPDIPINVIPNGDCSIYAAGASDGTNFLNPLFVHVKKSVELLL